MFIKPEYKHTINLTLYSAGAQKLLNSATIRPHGSGAGVSLTAREGVPAACVSFLIPEAGTLLVPPGVTGGQAQMDVRAGCCGE